MVNKNRRWPEGLSPDSGPVGQSNRPMVSQEIGGWRKEKAVIKEIRQQESMVEAGQSMIDSGSRSQFLEGFWTPTRVRFLFLVVFVFR
jgi:hypothetical protein